VKFTLNILEKRGGDEEKRWPRYAFGGRMRTSTVALMVAFLLVWWVYDTYRPEPEHGGPPSTQVVPPGFVPDPNYTWVPRSRVQEPPSVTYTPTTTTTTTTTPPPPTTTTTAPPPFVLPTLPCIPPFCTPSTTPAPQQPQPGPGPSPTSAPPAG
jgi:hypothetical protein